jgi:hypothetical protein
MERMYKDLMGNFSETMESVCEKQKNISHQNNVDICCLLVKAGTMLKMMNVINDHFKDCPQLVSDNVLDELFASNAQLFSVFYDKAINKS